MSCEFDNFDNFRPFDNMNLQIFFEIVAKIFTFVWIFKELDFLGVMDFLKNTNYTLEAEVLSTFCSCFIFVSNILCKFLMKISGLCNISHFLQLWIPVWNYLLCGFSLCTLVLIYFSRYIPWINVPQIILNTNLWLISANIRGYES